MPEDLTLATKQALRKRFKQRAASLSPQYRKEADERMLSLLVSSACYQRAASLFIYISMESEPDTRGIIERSWADGKQVYVPKCHGKGNMDAVLIASWDGLEKGGMNIPEPRLGPCLGAGEGADLCLIPCVSVTRTGIRLGHGGGYYDRWLAAHGGYAVCLCYEALIENNLPADRWDVAMNGVLTEKGLFPVR